LAHACSAVHVCADFFAMFDLCHPDPGRGPQAECHKCKQALDQISNATGEDGADQECGDEPIWDRRYAEFIKLEVAEVDVASAVEVTREEPPDPRQMTALSSMCTQAPPDVEAAIVEEKPPVPQIMAELPRQQASEEKHCCGEKCIYGPVIRLDEKEILRRSCWCVYCCCAGVGCTRVPVHLRLLCNCLCCRHSSESAACYGLDGCCSSSLTCRCCMSASHWPPIRGTPLCICCQEQFCGNHMKGEDTASGRGIDANRGMHDIDHQTSDVDFFLHETTVCCYVCCAGIAASQGSDGHFLDVRNKCCCCKCSVSNSCDEGCCSLLLTCWWLTAQCRVPPACSRDLNPIVGLCGCRLRNLTTPKHGIGPHGRGGNKHAPPQQKMMK